MSAPIHPLIIGLIGSRPAQRLLVGSHSDSPTIFSLQDTGNEWRGSNQRSSIVIASHCLTVLLFLVLRSYINNKRYIYWRFLELHKQVWTDIWQLVSPLIVWLKLSHLLRNWLDCWSMFRNSNSSSVNGASEFVFSRTGSILQSSSTMASQQISSRQHKSQGHGRSRSGNGFLGLKIMWVLCLNRG